MRGTVAVLTVLCGAATTLVAGPAFAAAAPPAAVAPADCPSPAQPPINGLITAAPIGTTAADTANGIASETLGLTVSTEMDVNFVFAIDGMASGSPAPAGAPAFTWAVSGDSGSDSMLWDGSGEFGGVGGNWVWSGKTGTEDLPPGSYSLFVTVGFTSGMAAGNYAAFFSYLGTESCSGAGGISSPAGVAALTYAPPAAGQSGGGGAGPGSPASAGIFPIPASSEGSVSATAFAGSSATASPSTSANGAATGAGSGSGSDRSASADNFGDVKSVGDATASSGPTAATFIGFAAIVVLLATGGGFGAYIARRRSPLTATGPPSASSATPDPETETETEEADPSNSTTDE